MLKGWTQVKKWTTYNKGHMYRAAIFKCDVDDKIIKMRMEQFDKDILHWKDYDFVVVNENLDKESKKYYNDIAKEL